MTTFIYTGNDKTLLNRYKEDSKDFFEIDYNLILNTLSIQKSYTELNNRPKKWINFKLLYII